MPRRRPAFDPRRILSALEASYVNYVLIGGLARVLRGTDEITDNVDICPSFAGANLTHLSNALAELGADRASVSEADLSADPVVNAGTTAGVLNIVASPTGAPNGFVDLRRAASREDLGHGIGPLVASTADLARLAAALGRDRDVEQLPNLRRIIELEIDRSQVLQQAPKPTTSTTQQRTSRTPRASR